MRARLIAFAALFLLTSPASANPAAAPPRSAICDLTGEWIGAGRDDGNTAWTFPFHARQTGRDLVATIEWSGSNGHSGIERVRGTVDCAARTLEMHTETVTGPQLVPGLYHAVIAPDSASISGRWDGPGVLPGRFTLRRR